jgi:hypothetical protein
MVGQSERLLLIQSPGFAIRQNAAVSYGRQVQCSGRGPASFHAYALIVRPSINQSM